MRARTASGTGPELAFAPEPTAAWLAGNRVFGSAPASGTGASVVFAGGVVRGGGVVAGDPVAVTGVVGDGVLLEVDPVTVAAEAAGVGVTWFETDEPALQPARARKVRMPAHVVPLAVPL